MNSLGNFRNHDEIIPLKFQLSQNYPNPFFEKTTIKYCIAYKSTVTITIHGSHGIIIKLLKEKKEAGTYEIEFYAYNPDTGQALPEGIYTCRLRANSFIYEKQMIIRK